MRTTIVSTSKLQNYKRFIFIVDGLVLVGLVSLLVYIHQVDGKWNTYLLPIIIYLQFHLYYPMFLKLKNIGYDEGSIYFNSKGYEVQVPFEEIHSIELRSLTGIYAIKFSQPIQGEKEVYFKASAWYPFNFKKRDEIVDELRNKSIDIKEHYQNKISLNYRVIESNCYSMRTTIVSTSKLKVFKKIYYGFIIFSNLLVLAIIVPLNLRSENYIQLLFLPILWFFSLRVLQDLKKMRTISYDDTSIFYQKDGYEVQIPFEDIKGIELDRGWRINLYRPTQDGDRIMFLPSVWYPFNFVNAEERINKLRDKIDDYRRVLPKKDSHQLSSYRI